MKINPIHAYQPPHNIKPNKVPHITPNTPPHAAPNKTPHIPSAEPKHGQVRAIG